MRPSRMGLEEDCDHCALADIMTKGVSQPQWTMCIEGLLGQPLKPSDKSPSMRISSKTPLI
jgi:hypothetical protein